MYLSCWDEENEIDGEALIALSADDMKEVIKPLGVRVKLTALIRKERDVDTLVNDSHVSDAWDVSAGDCAYGETTHSEVSIR